MEFKTPSNPFDKGFTFMEIILTVAVIVVLMSSVLMILSPKDTTQRGRDNKRLSDLSTLDRAINEFSLDNSVYPGDADVLYTSTSLPSGCTNLYSSAAGWIDADLSTYTVKLPTDPLNDDTYFYSYMHNGQSYELNSVLESLLKRAAEDGGDNAASYEIGNNLMLIY